MTSAHRVRSTDCRALAESRCMQMSRLSPALALALALISRGNESSCRLSIWESRSAQRRERRPVAQQRLPVQSHKHAVTSCRAGKHDDKKNSPGDQTRKHYADEVPPASIGAVDTRNHCGAVRLTRRDESRTSEFISGRLVALARNAERRAETCTRAVT